MEKTKKNLDEGDLEGPTTETVELEPVEKETEEPESEEGKLFIRWASILKFDFF